ncbi:MAG: EscS/YscS/HrcS family type III secretion system export apparatus protein [Bdellovibrionales bacterium RIFOXYD1_FULL_53_11]|nr:MAG: EscS/YscS/HrcS family type III secretion system export apparatus protein [Bdellovibrionales bacterium RIFOXYD1_FULL_53_11]
MSEDMVMTIGSDAIRTAFYVAGPMLAAAMLIGIVISVLQAITQINEATLTFIPKMVAVVVVLAVLAPWMLQVLQQFTADMIGNAGEMVR